MTSSLEKHGTYSYDDDVYIDVIIPLFVIIVYRTKPSFSSQSETSGYRGGVILLCFLRALC
jgi:hypothetical protein